MVNNHRSHLDIEFPLFVGKPHLWIQWKGTDVCCDIHCSCGYFGHYDGGFFYLFRCPECGQVWKCGTHVYLYPVKEEDVKGAIITELKEEDE